MRSRPQASSAFDGITTRRPGMCVKFHLAALAVIDGAAVEIAADGDAQHQRRGESAVGAPADGGQLIANLHHGGPDVIEELNLGDRLQPARGHADGAADDAASASGVLKHALRAELRFAARGDFENAAFAFHF